MPRRLARTVRADQFEVRCDSDFDGVIEGCAGPRRDSGVLKGHLEDLQRPKRPRLKEGEQPRQRVRFPTMDRVGLMVALARTDLLDPRLGAAVLLLVAT
ncbi:hypothetical protein ABK046_45025, partial [Streptomyces caeruleatus]